MDSAKSHLIAWHQQPLEVIAEQIIHREKASLPDLSSVTVLLGDVKPAVQLRQHLLRAAKKLGHTALLGPRIMKLHDWVMQYCPADIKICDPQLQRLILVEALKQHPDMIKAANIWALTDDLLSLFSDLTLNLNQLPDHLEEFTLQLQQAYGIQTSTLEASGQEATLVFTLWHAWHSQLEAYGLTDRHTAYLLALSNSIKQVAEDEKIVIAGFQNQFTCEREWLNLLTSKLPVQLFYQGQINESMHDSRSDDHLTDTIQQQEPEVTPAVTSSAQTTVLDTIFATHMDILLARSQAMAKDYLQSPISKNIQIFEAAGSEEEARAVDVQVRQWLIDGHRRIGIITENRKLARRVRALLERADVILNDEAGWALSTTSAAASLERWLECIEQDFAWHPLLDLLKSPFCFPQHDSVMKQHASMRLEQDIVHQENIESNLQRYQLAISERASRLPHWYVEATPLLNILLKDLEEAAAPITNLLQQNTTPLNWLETINDSLHRLGMITTFDADDAGSRVLQVLEEMKLAASRSDMALDWIGFRTWLGRSLEQSNFQVTRNEHDIHLLNLAQSQLLDFDAIIVASAERDIIPGRSAASAFFNDSVRKELNLSTQADTRRESFYYFRRLLQAAPRILLTSRVTQDGEPIVISPWLEALQSFHQLTWGQPLSAPFLKDMVHQEKSSVIRATNRDLPAQCVQPHPAVPDSLLTTDFSASSYQQLMNCPYQYFAARCLKLAAKEELSIALSKSDYGERIHLCLQAFHSDVQDLPGPFSAQINESNRSKAIEVLTEISNTVFAVDIDIRIEHQGWLNQWQKQIPAYIDWQTERQQHWNVHALEVTQQRDINPQIKLKGQLDRIDEQGHARAVIDYKTGNIPKEQEVLLGEAVQLPFYAALASQAEHEITEVAYLKFDNKGGVTMPFQLEGETLKTVSEENTARLTTVIQQLHNGDGMPAWGDTKTCSYCTMHLLCRHEVWKNDE